MSNIKPFYLFINELKASTWRNASNKSAELGQNKLATEFKKKYEDTVRDLLFKSDKVNKEACLNALKNKSSLENQILLKHVYDFYIESYYAIDTDEYITYEGVTKIMIDDHWLESDDLYTFSVQYLDLDRSKEIESEIQALWLDGSEIDSNLSLSHTLDSISITDHPPYIRHYLGNKNKFANKRSVINFINTLEELYFYQDNSRAMDIIYKLNDMSGDSKVENGDFHSYINDIFGSWDNFKSKLKIRQLYDVYKK